MLIGVYDTISNLNNIVTKSKLNFVSFSLKQWFSKCAIVHTCVYKIRFGVHKINVRDACLVPYKITIGI